MFFIGKHSVNGSSKSSNFSSEISGFLTNGGSWVWLDVKVNNGSSWSNSTVSSISIVTS